MILGTYAGGQAPRTDYNQTDPAKADYLVGREKIAEKDSIGTNKVFNKLTDIGITSFPTTMKTVANAMPANSTLMLDSRDIIDGGTHEISDLGLNNAGMYMFMRGNSNERLSLLHIYGATSTTTSYMNFGCYAATNNSVVWKRVDLSDFAPSGYGYGGQAINLGIFDNEDDLTNAISSVYDNMGNLETKLVRFEGYPSNSSYNFFGILAKGSANNGNLFAHCAYSRGSLLQKVKYQGVWQPFEWVNPPMNVGVEYRTTERYNGKPVYRKLLSYSLTSNLSGDTELKIPHGIENWDGGLARVQGKTVGYILPYIASNGSTTVPLFEADGITLKNTGATYWSAKRQFFFELWYTKTE